MSLAELEPAQYQNPLENEEGLSDEDKRISQEFPNQLKNAEAHNRALRRRRFEDYHRTIGREINEMLEEHHARRQPARIEKAAKKHYEQNEAKYQVQAVKDAAAEGVHTNFGT